MIHIVFQEADIQVLAKAIEMDPGLQGPVEIIRDDYAVGPIEGIYESEGYQQRRDWWKTQLEATPYPVAQLMNLVDDRLAVHNLKKQLDEDPKEVLWIWMGQNQHDVCGYYWLISQLQPYQGRVIVLYLNNLPFINEKGQIFYPTNLHEIQPKEFLKAKKLNRAVTPSEFEVDPDEWRKLMAENAMVRILEGGKKIVSREAEFYDQAILAGLGKDWLKGNRAIHNILSKMKLKTGDVYLLSRIKALADQGQVMINGDPARGWKDFELKLPSGDTVHATGTEENAGV